MKTITGGKAEMNDMDMDLVQTWIAGFLGTLKLLVVPLNQPGTTDDVVAQVKMYTDQAAASAAKVAIAARNAEMALANIKQITGKCTI